MTKIINNTLPVVIFAVLSLIIVFPLLSPGFILTMDIAFTPKLPIPSLTSPVFFFGSLLGILNMIIPSYVLQKIMLFFVFFLSGWGMYRLVSKKYGFIAFFGGIFYAVNPFVYERVMAGQWQFLLGYSILPFFISAVINFFEHLQKKDAIILAIWSWILINLAVHFSLIMVIIILVYGSVFLYLYPGKIILTAKQLILFGLIAILLNINWLFPAVLGRSGVSQSISVFDSSDLLAFQSVPDKNFGLIINLLSGFGFWPEAYNYFVSSKSVIFFWPLLSLLFASLSLYGLFRMFLEKDKSSFPLLTSFIVLFLISLDLAGGVALKSFSGFVYYLYNIFPPLRGFREPQKLVGIVMLCYAYFGTIGLYDLFYKAKKNILFYFLCFAFFIMPFIYTPTVFGGFWGQLKPVFYPESWYKINKLLISDKDNFLTVFFPWHQYTNFNFANGRMVINPALYFFDKPIITAENYETISLDTHDIRTEALHIEGLLSIEKEGVNMLGEPIDEKLSWGQSLSPINVKYIILSKDEDWMTYKFLDEQTDLNKTYESVDVILYRNLSYGKETYLEENQVYENIPDMDVLPE